MREKRGGGREKDKPSSRSRSGSRGWKRGRESRRPGAEIGVGRRGRKQREQRRTARVKREGSRTHKGRT